MDYRWLQGDIENYSFYELAKRIIPKTEFPVEKYQKIDRHIISSNERFQRLLQPRFHYVTKQEETAILNGTWDESINYEDSKMKYGFYFPDVELGELNFLFPTWFCEENIDSLIKNFYFEDNGIVYLAKKYLVKCVFIILHEYGHYVDYKKFSNKAEYAKWIYESKLPFRKNDKIIEELKNQGLLTKEIYQTRMKIYRECFDESSADKYALDNLNQTVEKALDIIYG